jgi:hypothetical protein
MLFEEFYDMKQISTISEIPYWKVYKFLRAKVRKSELRCKQLAAKVALVREFFLQDDISLICPEARHEGHRYCQETLPVLYEIFKAWMRDVAIDKGWYDAGDFWIAHKIGYSTFARMRPREVRSSSKVTPRMCVCDRCENCKNPIEMLQSKNVVGLPKTSLHDIFKELWCDYDRKDKFPAYVCAKRSCPHCSTDSFKEKILDQNRNIDWQMRVKYQWWVKTPIPGSYTSKKLALVDKEATLEELLDVLCAKLAKESMHFFVSIFQAQQIRDLRRNLRPRVLMSTMDFAQNYLNTYQDEPQGTHWAHVQTTMFPIVNCYTCPRVGCPEQVLHEQIFFSNDIRNHNHFCVDTCTAESLRDLEENYNLRFDCQIRVTDNCPKQFKSKGPFIRLSESRFPTIYTYFGARHGRSLADRAVGVTKREMNRARLARVTTLRNAREIYEYLKKKDVLPKGPNSCCHYIRTHHLIEEIDVGKFVPDKGLDGTTKFHEVRSTGVDNVVEARDLACLCDGCLWRDCDCIYEKWVQPWRKFTLDKAVGKNIENVHFPLRYRKPKCKPCVESVATCGSIADLSDVREADLIPICDPSSIPPNVQ